MKGNDEGILPENRWTCGVRRVIAFENESLLAAFALELWREATRDSLAERGSMSVALSGGRTPVAFYRDLAREKGCVNRESTHFFFADERYVPPADRDSNYRVVRETIFDPLLVPPENIHGVAVGEWSVEEAADRYEQEIGRHFGLSGGQMPCFDLILLGVGEDGHTASLFPDSPALDERHRLARAVSPGGMLQDRVTLTLPVINNARRILFLVEGPAKAQALKRTIEEGGRFVPASLVRPLSGCLLFLVDRDAAGLLAEASYETARGEDI